MSPFLMLCGQEALMPEEIPHVTYASNISYEVAIEKHIEKMLAIHQETLKKNQISVQESKEYFDRKFVKKSQLHNFVIGNIVLMNVKKELRTLRMLGYNGLAHVPWFTKDLVNCMKSNMNVRVVWLNI